jgi:predicted SnoaL-like aldol condensation-catalyzing enzyme
MRTILFAASAGLICCFTSCNDKTRVSGASSTDNAQAQKNLDASHVINRAFETGDVNGIDSVVASDFVDHTDHGEVKGRDSLKAMVTMVRQTNKDMKMDIVNEVADNDYVYSWMRFRGTSDGSMMPAGPYDMRAIEVAKFRDGKIVEHWEFMEMGDMMKMMQQMQGMNNKMEAKKDSTKANK